MVKVLRSFLIPSLPFKLLTKIPPPTNRQFYPNRFTSLLSNSISNGSHSSPLHTDQHLLDEMSQRTAYIFQSLNLSKQNPIDPAFIDCIHSRALKTNALADIPIWTSLLTAYARARDLDSSLALFNEAAVAQDLISWNAVISACVLNSQFDVSINLFQEMVDGFGEFDSTTLVVVLSALSRTQNLKYGLILHGTVFKRGFKGDVYLCNALVDMYAKCGELSESLTAFEEIEVKDATSWNSTIKGCLYNNSPMESASFYRGMCCSDVRPDQVSLSCVISACSCLEDLFDFGESVHAWVIKLGYEGIAHSSVDNSLISFYSSCGYVEASEKVFQRLYSKNVISLNSMIKCLIENGRVDGGVHLFRSMQSTSEVQPDAITLVTITPVCGEFNLLLQGKSIHGFSVRKQIGSNISVVNSLLDMYLKCDDLISADILFRIMPNRDLVTWNTIISGYSGAEFYREESQILFRELLQEGQSCSLATLLAILPSCSCTEDLKFGKSVHCWELKYGFGNIISATNALMLMYINCGDLIASSMLLQTILPVSDVVSWNTVISGFVKNGYYKDGLGAFQYMRQYLNLEPDPVTLVSVLSACGNLELLLYCRSLHGLVLKSPIGTDIRVRNALITMYFRCGDTTSSELVFKTEGDRNLCSWSSMICGFVQNHYGGKALEYFRHLEILTFKPNEISIVGLLCTCTHLGNLRLGMEVHGYIFHLGFSDNMFISSALVDMYSKCGRLDIAILVFENSQEKTVASWNSIISAYGFHGQGRKAIELFSKMCDLGVRATKSTFVALLSACSHNGLVDEGWKHYKLMIEEFGLEETVEHRVLMVDMLGRAGRLHEAYKFVEEMGHRAESEVWGALLSACRDHGDLKMGKSIAEHLFRLDSENTGYYVTLSNLYAYHGMWGCAEDIRGLIHDRRLTKPTGISLVDLPGR